MLQGSLVALITPFRNGAVDEKGFQDFVDWQIGQGTHGLVPCGTTGESPTLSHDEHKRVVELCVEAAKGRVPVIAGTGSNSTDEAIDFTRHAKKAGADAALVVTPLLQQADPGRPLPAFQGDPRRRRPADHHLQHPGAHRRRHERRDHGAARQAAEHRRRQGRDRRSGAAAAHARWRSAPISACCRARTRRRSPSTRRAATAASRSPPMSRRAPAPTCRRRGVKGDTSGAMKINERLAPLHDALFCETSPAPVKYAVSLLGKASPDVRLPLVPRAPRRRARCSRRCAPPACSTER